MLYWASPYSSEYGLIMLADAPGSGSRLARKSHSRKKNPPCKSFARWIDLFCGLDAGARRVPQTEVGGKSYFLSFFIELFSGWSMYSSCRATSHSIKSSPRCWKCLYRRRLSEYSSRKLARSFSSFWCWMELPDKGLKPLMRELSMLLVCLESLSISGSLSSIFSVAASLQASSQNCGQRRCDIGHNGCTDKDGYNA